MGYNDKIDMDARSFIAVTDSVQLLKKLQFEAIFVDEAHHPLAPGLPSCQDLFQFSATHKEEADYKFGLGEAIEKGVLCDYDLTVPVATEGHPYICLANLLLSQSGRFRRVLAFCNSLREARRFQQVLETVGLAAWHMNGETGRKGRAKILCEFSGELQRPVHVLVTVQVLGEGVNIPNADTCLFVEPRSSFVSIIQAIGRVLRHHPRKPLAQVILPALTVPKAPVAAAAAQDAVLVGSEDSSLERPLLASTLRHQAHDRQAEASAPSATASFIGAGPPAQQLERRHRQTSRLQEQLQLGNTKSMVRSSRCPGSKPPPRDVWRGARCKCY